MWTIKVNMRQVVTILQHLRDRSSFNLRNHNRPLSVVAVHVGEDLFV